MFFFKNLNLNLLSFEKTKLKMEDLSDDELVIEYAKISEKEEELDNQFYDGLEAVYGKGDSESEDELESDDESKQYSSEFKSPEGFQDLKSSDNDEEIPKDIPPSKIPMKLRPLSPVRLVDISEVSLPSIEGVEKIDYTSLLHREIGESAEMFEMRVKLAEIFSNASIPRGSKFVSLDVRTVMLFSRMMTNKLWLGMEYNKDQENLLKATIDYIPELKEFI
jgi:hypothetical protein